MPVCTLIFNTIYIYYFKLLTISIFIVKNIKDFKIKIEIFKYNCIIKTTNTWQELRVYDIFVL